MPTLLTCPVADCLIAASLPGMVLLAGGDATTVSVDFLNGFNEAMDMPPLVQPVADSDVKPARKAAKAMRRVRRVAVTFSPLVDSERRSSAAHETFGLFRSNAWSDHYGPTNLESVQIVQSR